MTGDLSCKPSNAWPVNLTMVVIVAVVLAGYASAGQYLGWKTLLWDSRTGARATEALLIWFVVWLALSLSRALTRQPYVSTGALVAMCIPPVLLAFVLAGMLLVMVRGTWQADAEMNARLAARAQACGCPPVQLAEPWWRDLLLASLPVFPALLGLASPLFFVNLNRAIGRSLRGEADYDETDVTNRIAEARQRAGLLLVWLPVPILAMIPLSMLAAPEGGWTVGKSLLWVAPFAPALVLCFYFQRRVKRRLREALTELAVCHKCHYDLTGNVSGVCPECGTRWKDL